jgi:hypothetical protein
LEKAHPVRKIIREALAISFWFHALCAFHLVYIRSFAIPPEMTLHVYNAVLFGFIIYFSYFSDSGWLSVIWDVLYIYLWPLRTAWRICVMAFKAIYQFMKSHSTFPRVGLIVAPVVEVNPRVAESKSLRESWSEYLTEKRKARVINNLKRALRPINQFAFLWAILILTLQYPPLIVIASIVTLAGAFRAVYNLWNLLSSTSKWIGKLHGGLATQISAKIRQVGEWEEAVGPEPIRNEVNSLKMFESVFTYISDNREFLSKCTMGVAALITIPFYLYISLLFSSVYVGIAHLEHINLSWTTSIIDSLYVPFAFTDFPHNNAIRFVAGLQAVALTAMGWNIFFRHLSGKFNEVAVAAAEFRSTMQDENYRQKIALVASLSSSKTTDAERKKPPASVLPSSNSTIVSG